MDFGDREMIKSPASSSSSAFSSSSATIMNLCRICHEEEDDNSSSMESPCSCSGTLKFAHRGCIQRWCYEKGSNVCEICLQKFEPAYPAALPSAAKLPLIDTFVIVRRSLAKNGYESETSAAPVIAGSLPETEHIVPSTPYVHRISWCRLTIIIITVIFLLRNFISVVSGDADGYPFSIATVLILRGMGILLPFWLLMRLVTVIQDEQKLHLPNYPVAQILEDEDKDEDEDDDLERQ